MPMRSYEELVREFEEMEFVPVTENTVTGKDWDEWIREDDVESEDSKK